MEEQEKKDEDVKGGSDKEIQGFPPFFVVFFFFEILTFPFSLTIHNKNLCIE